MGWFVFLTQFRTGKSHEWPDGEREENSLGLAQLPSLLIHGKPSLLCLPVFRGQPLPPPCPAAQADVYSADLAFQLSAGRQRLMNQLLEKLAACQSPD